jgi:hypothetical protein
LVVKFVEFVEMTSESGAIGESFGAQRALMDVREVCLYVEGSLKGIVRPVDAVGAGVTTA